MPDYVMIGVGIALLVITGCVIYAFLPNRRHGGYASGGIVGSRRLPPVVVQLGARDHASPHFHSIRERMRTLLVRSNFHPTTRNVLEALDLMQKPEVAAVLHPVDDAIMPELRVRGKVVDINEFLAPNSRSCCLTYEGEPHFENCPVRQELHRSFDATLLAEADALTGVEGEPLPTPALPNIGGEDHPPYAGPNYVSRKTIVDEMHSLIHTGTESGDDKPAPFGPGRMA